MIDELTFRRIEVCKGIVMNDLAGDSSLDEWYQSVRDKPLMQFSDKDWGIVCRQQLYLEFVVPALLSRLKSDPLAGDIYDGELLVALAAIPNLFWEDNVVPACYLRTLLESVVIETDDNDVLAAWQKLLSVKLKSPCVGPQNPDRE